MKLSWCIGNLYNSFSRVGVSLFIMLSGALLLAPKDESLQVFYKKRLGKVLVPLIIWSCIYVFWNVMFHGGHYTAWEVLKKFLGGGVETHLWFVYIIIGLYIVTPIFWQYLKSAAEKNILYLLIVWLISTTVFPLFPKLFGFNVILIPATGYAGYFILGYYLSKVDSSRVSMGALAGLFIAGAAATMYGTYYLTLKTGGTLDTSFYDPLTPNIVLVSVAAFLALKKIGPDAWSGRGRVASGAVTLISRKSFGIYFVHVLAIDVIISGRLGFRIWSDTLDPAVGPAIFAVATLVFSLVAAMALAYIPVVKKIVP